MYTCEQCGKEYTSQKRFHAHVDRHNKGDDRSVRSRASSRSVMSRVSRRQDDISDIEREDRAGSRVADLRSLSSFSMSGRKFRQTVEKLMRDKTKLKSELKKYSNELQRKVGAHQDEQEQQEKYYNDQLLLLTEERDILTDSLNNVKEEVFNEREKLREDFRVKINNYKEQIDKRYGNNNSKQVKRLENTIEKLQDRLNEQLEDKEKAKDTLEMSFSEREEGFREQMDKKDDMIRTIKDTINAERSEFRRLTSTYQVEKDAFKLRCIQEKEEEIILAITNKNSIIKTLESVQKQLRKSIEEAQGVSAKTISDLKVNHQQALLEKDSQRQQLNLEFSTQYQTNKRQLEKKIESMKQDCETQIKEMEKDVSIRVKVIEKKGIRDIENVVEEMEEEKKCLSENIKEREEEIAKKDACISTMGANISTLKADFTYKINSDMKVIKEKLQEKFDKEKKEMMSDLVKFEEESHKYKIQSESDKETLQKLRNETNKLKQQFIGNLNQQKKANDQVVKEREERSTTLENLISKTRYECEDKMRLAKLSIDNSNRNMDKLKNDLRIKNDDLDHLQKRLSETENFRKNVENSYEKRIGELNVEHDKKMYMLKNDIETEYKALLNNADTALQKEKSMMSSLRTEFTLKINSNLDIVKKEYKEKSNAKCAEYKDQLKKKDDYIANLGSSIVRIKQDRELIKKKVKDEHDVDYKEHQNQLKQKDEHIATMRTSIGKIKADFAHKINSDLKTAKKNIREKYDVDYEEHKKQLKEKESYITALNANVIKMKNDFIGRLNAVTKERDDLEKRISKYKVYEDQTNNTKSVEEELARTRKDFMVKMNNQYIEDQTKVDRLEKNISKKTSEVATLKETIEANKIVYMQKLSVRVNITPAERIKLKELEELVKQQDLDIKKDNETLTSLDKTLSTIQTQLRREKENNEKYKQDLTYKTRELDDIRKHPPRNSALEGKLRKMRDDCLEAMRNQKLQMNKQKSDGEKMNHKLNVAENVIKEKIQDSVNLMKLHEEMKESFITNLNKQKDSNQELLDNKEKLLKQKDSRIIQLETILSETVQTVTKNSEAVDKKNDSIRETLKLLESNDRVLKVKEKRNKELENVIKTLSQKLAQKPKKKLVSDKILERKLLERENRVEELENMLSSITLKLSRNSVNKKTEEKYEKRIKQLEKILSDTVKQIAENQGLEFQAVVVQ